MSSERRRMSPYERALETFGRSPAGNWYLRRIAPRIDPPMLRLTGGRVSSVYPTPVMLLTTTGAKSGQPRTLPLLYLTDGERLVLMASNYGKPSHPAWYRNLTANPTVEYWRASAAEPTRPARSRTQASVIVSGSSRSISTPATATITR